MREFQFRYWYSNKMVEVGQLDFFTDTQICVNDELVGGVLMQYTGLKDKNGKEIYEGDLLGGILETGVVQWDQIRGGWVINFSGELNEVYWYELDDMKDLEVIGNIYENPELLKEAYTR